MKTITVGLPGCGTVGTGVARLLYENRDLLEARVGATINLKYVADIDTQKDRGIPFAQGVLKLLNGSLKGKEYLLIQKRLQISSSEQADIHLPLYPNVAEIHAQIRLRDGEVFIHASDSKHRVLINEIQTTEAKLKLEDVIQIGSAKFLFFYQ